MQIRTAEDLAHRSLHEPVLQICLLNDPYKDCLANAFVFLSPFDLLDASGSN